MIRLPVGWIGVQGHIVHDIKMTWTIITLYLFTAWNLDIAYDIHTFTGNLLHGIGKSKSSQGNFLKGNR